MASFEEKLIALSSAETLKKGKAHLKQKALAGAWRNKDGGLCGVFASDGMLPVETVVSTGENAVSTCSCNEKEFSLCSHAVALLMYSGRFALKLQEDEAPPVYSKGLVKQSFAELSARGMSNSAKLYINVVEDQLHAPNQYKILLLNIRLAGASREYSGNLNNLKQLYFNKSLSVVLKYEDFSLHDQQIIRFLALNGTADNSMISLGAELASELFHALGGFPRFFRAGNRIIIRPERAEPVLVKVKDKIVPGIRIADAVLPLDGARVIAGRAGSWVGKHDEYFFIGGNCEASFLRSFFRLQVRDRKELEKFPLPIEEAGSIAPEPRAVKILLDGSFDEHNSFMLKIQYLYDCDGRQIICAPRTGRVFASGKRCFARDIRSEAGFENMLSLFGMDILEDASAAFINDTVKAGVFLDKALPEMVRSMGDKITFTAAFAALCGGGCGLKEVSLRCKSAGKLPDAHIIAVSAGEPGEALSWEKLNEYASARKNYIPVRGKLYRISAPLGKFVRASGAVVRNFNIFDSTFEVPFVNWKFFCTLAGAVPGALPVELLFDSSEESGVQSMENFRFKGTLRTYQKQGVSFMQYLVDRSFNPLLADEMGLGKTVQLLALLASRMDKNGNPSLIVCPASLTVNWAREAAKFVPGFRVAAPTGAERVEVLKNGGFDLLILSYTAVKLCQNLLKKYCFSFLVLDEAQHIKNPGSGNARNCKSINAAHRVVLTGTPLENTPEDLWSVMDFLQPGLLGTLNSFRRRYAGIALDSELQEEFTGRISPFIKRRTKAEVASDLPEKHESTIFCEMSAAQREFYAGVLEENRATLKNGSSADLFALLLRLRQCCCHPELLPDGKGSEIPSAKTELLFELLHETIDSGHKVLLFSQFTSMLKLLVPKLDSAGIPFEYLDGATRDRQERVDRFNNDPSVPLFLLSLKAGGTGLNLTSADTVIIYDPWWNPAVELQAADRTHRIGQTRTVSTVKLVMKDSVEEKVLLLQQKKRELFQSLVENPSASGGISLAELRALME
ncbi:MAG: DEAD/DEAH box helicase [Lentisphaerae bacterium]|nr:DEAD/DEAH box helicase [Lentisphaerota bacterium]